MTGPQPEVRKITVVDAKTGTKYTYPMDTWLQIRQRAHNELLSNPNDEEAKEALGWAGQALGQSPPDESQMAAGQGNPESAWSQIPKVMKGIGQGVLDIPASLGHAIAHAPQVVDQLTQFNPFDPMRALEAAKGVVNQPGWENKLDATFRALPTNLGYAPERSLMDATGAGGLFTPERSTEPTQDTQEIARRATNVGSLSLFGIGAGRGSAPKNFSRFGPGEIPPTGGNGGMPSAGPMAPFTPEATSPVPVPKPQMAPNPIDANWSLAPEELGQQPQLALPKPKPAELPARPQPQRVQGQKEVTFGPESPLSPTSRAEVKDLLGQMAGDHGPGTLEPIPGAPKGFTARGPAQDINAPRPPSIAEILYGARDRMNKHTPESIMGTDQLANGMKMPGEADVALGKNNGPDVPMGLGEGGFLGGGLGEAATIIFSPRLYLLLRRLNRTPQDLIGASRTNMALKAVVQDLTTASLFGQTDRIKDLEDQIAAMLQNNGPKQR